MPEDENNAPAGTGAPSRADDAPLYYVERCAEGPNSWRVMGPNGAIGAYRNESEAQAKADQLNEEVAEEQEDDF